MAAQLALQAPASHVKQRWVYGLSQVREIRPSLRQSNESVRHHRATTAKSQDRLQDFDTPAKSFFYDSEGSPTTEHHEIVHQQ
ncbi:unannotated protein [freshwater metagenome]|uniref:Unannotated protein n=1 Tax=freshwater metagenome TaxID=449393 RepID=A0A6J6S5B6_9ZZZZ